MTMRTLCDKLNLSDEARNSLTDHQALDHKVHILQRYNTQIRLSYDSK